jgi:flagellar protein FliS
MSYATAATRYREEEVLTASPARLVVIMYDHLLANLRRAQLAAESDNVEQYAESLNRVRDTVMELLVTIDSEKGGEIARQLRWLYTFLLSELFELTHRRDAKRIARLSGIATELRTAFAAVSSGPPALGPAA